MKKYLYPAILCVFLMSCKEDDQSVFDKTADERVAEAIANLRNELVAPQDGWLLQYRPEEEMGVYNVLLKFDAGGMVNIKTDLSANDGEFYEQTVPYRIDNAQGLELIFEAYSFFSYLFERDLAGFGAEFEFLYVNQTPDGALVFASKSDPSPPTSLIFLPADESDINLLGRELSRDLSSFSASMKLSFEDEDVAFYLTRDNLRRTITFKSVSAKSDLNDNQSLNFTTGYVIRGDSVILSQPLSAAFNGKEYSIASIAFNELSSDVVNICPEPAEAPVFHGAVNQSGEAVVLENSLQDPEGAKIFEQSTVFAGELFWITDENDMPVYEQITEDIPGAVVMYLLYDLDNPDIADRPLNAIGFYLINDDDSETLAVKEFTAEFEENNLQLNFADSVTQLFDRTETNLEGMDFYLDKLTEADRTYVIQLFPGAYEFYNPCSGWRFYFVAN